MTSTILRPINSRLRRFCPQVGRGARTEADPNSESSISGQRGLFSRAMQYFHISNKRGPYLFPFAFFKPQSLLDLHGPVLHLFSHFDILRYTPFPSPPPTLGGGTYAIIGKRSHREFCTRNLHTYFSLVVKILVCESKHTQATIDRDPNYRYKHSRKDMYSIWCYR